MTEQTSTYKVWVIVEELDENEDHVRDIDLDFSSITEFGTETEAWAFARQLQGIGEAISCYTEADWREEVTSGNTVLGLQEWREHKLEEAIHG